MSSALTLRYRSPRTLHRVLFTMLFALLLVGTQQAALVHELGHIFAQSDSQAELQVPGGQLPDPATHDRSGYCEKCFQFAHVFGAGPLDLPVHLPPAVGNEMASARLAAELPADAPQSRSRGPPAFL